LGCTDAGRLTAFFVSSAVLNLVAAVFMLTLSFLEHSRTPRPSILLNAYLFLTLLFDITQCRSLWLAAVNPADEAFACVFTVSCALKVVLIVMESQQKSKWLQWNMKDHSPEEISGLYSLGAFFWLNKLFLKGYRKLLTLDDLFPLDQTMVSEALGKKLEVYLEVNPTHEQKFGLTKGMAKVLAVPLLLPVVPRIALLAFSFCQPFLINSLLLYLESPESERSANWGYGLIGATTIIYSGIAVSSAFYNYYRERFLWMARGALASVIYKKTTQSKISGTDGSAALTLMSTDIERIRWGFMGLHDFWASAVQIGLASWLLYRELGIAFIGPIIVILLCTICVTFLSRFSGKTQKAWMEQIQKRVGLTSNMIANMKHLKISGLTEPVETLVQKLRVNEISAGNRWRITMVIAAVASFTPSMIGPVVAFAFSAQTLNVTRTFTSMSFLTLLTAPLASILQLVPLLLAALTCLQRIQAFLEKEPRSDFRESTLVRLSEKSDNVAAGEETSAVMRISNGNFGWGAGKTSLKNLEFNIPPYSLTMVVGPIASGKSTLCKVLLGETPVYSGHITMALASRRVGYCDQVPFLSNSTVRENIVGYSSFNSARYNEVVEATMLLPDFAVLRHGDCTKVGSNGITLSGGQKQRVSMARALYSSSDFLIFDDILSGLDADTEEQVFQRVFGPDGLVRRRKSTAILCTHSVRHLPAADHIIALGPEGCLVEQGTFEDLVSNENYVHSLGVKAADKHDGDVKPCSSVDGLKTEELGATPLTRRHTLVSVASSHVDERNRQIGDSTVYRHYAKSMKLSALILFILADMATGFLSYLPQIWLNYWSADVMSPQRAHSEAFWVGVYALLRVLGLVFQGLACVIILITIISQSGTTLHHQTLHTVISAPLRFFTKTDAGIVTNLFSQDMTLIDTELPLALLNVMINIFACIGMAAVVATSSPYIAISYPFLIAILWVIQNFYLRTSRQLRLLDLEAKSPL
jgi:ATP-binding cassette subfamily C (CFTR/MRP) protein 1